MNGRIEKKTRTSWADPESNKKIQLGNHYKFRTEKTGHFFTHGSLTEKTRFVWLCLHGYGSLAKYFIQKFEFLDPELHYVVVPEGLNRFYEGVNERPAVSWMTKEDRLDEIADYVEMLERLRKKLNWDHNPDVQVIYFGFSQGVTTLIRWMTNIHPRCNHLILWAGSIPDDILLEPHQSYFESMATYYFIGKSDPYFKENRFNEIEQLIKQARMLTQVQWFEGEHKVEDAVLQQWVKNYLINE